MATHSSILAWRIPQTSSLAGYSPWGHKESGMTEATLHIHMHTLVYALHSQCFPVYLCLCSMVSDFWNTLSPPG